jgi:hypothetical protein
MAATVKRSCSDDRCRSYLLSYEELVKTGEVAEDRDVVKCVESGREDKYQSRREEGWR